MEKFIAEYSYIVVLIVMIVEYLIGASKLKSNSTIDVVLNVLKYVFKIKGSEDEKKSLEKQ